MSFQLSAQAITAHTAITRMSVSRCSILPPQRGSTTAPKCPTSRSIAMLRSPTFGEEDHPWLSNSPASGISCVAPVVGEWRASGERKYYLSNLPPRTALRALAAAIKARWVCEQGHQQLKQELGLGHFE